MRALQTFIEFTIRWRYALLAIAVALGVAGALTGRSLTLDRSIENMFAEDDPILVPYRRLQRTFGENEIVMAIYADEQLTSDSGKERIGTLVEKLRATPGVVAAVSLLDPPGAADFENLEIGARFREVFSGYTHNTELDAAGIICLIERPQHDGTPRHETLAQMRAAISEYPSGVLVGEPVLIEEAFDLLEVDGKQLNTWCTALVLMVLLVCFRNLRWVILPLAVVHLTLALTRATLVLAHLKLSMVSSMLAAIVTVVGVATIVHVIVRFRNALREGLCRRAALSKAAEQLVVPVTFACLTDAAGFASLMISEVGPVQDFGLMMAIGSLLVLPSCWLLCAGLMLLGTDNDTENEPTKPTSEWLDRVLGKVLSLAHQRRGLLAALAVALAVFAILGTQRLERETEFTKNFRPGSPLVGAYGFVETRFGGAGVWDLQFPAPQRPDKKFLLKVLELEEQLKAKAPQLSKAISLADTLDAGVGGLHRRFVGSMAVRGGLATIRARMPEFVDTITNIDPKDERPWMRILLRAPEQLGAEEKTQLIEQVEALGKKQFPEAEVTGYYVLLTKLIESVLADQWKTFGLATLAVVLMMAVAFRSLPLAVLTMIPNTLPVLVLFGAMGWLGVRVNMGAAMIAAVSVGLSVDGSIHYVLGYQRLRRQGMSSTEALASTQSTVGRAAVFATLALVAGFATLAFSDFVPTAYFGVLVSLSMLGGLVGNLAVLPLLIGLVDRQL
ncbi:efflux RND transporter permease subunit [Adhaeretor mobilis]|uniref:efflux RND transporter permease subunit n=1 Tax=Adhaeretor mobilis TaxID=1930276 RepID=UPI0011A240F8|nr:MMPL family transporter [Adhaeretor mobilis]